MMQSREKMNCAAHSIMVIKVSSI